jgi:Colicin V production protein
MGSVGHIEGSAQWQTAAFIIAIAWILVSAVRGWGKGLMRQLAGIVALFAAGFLVLHYTGEMEEFLRPHVPPLILIFVSAVLIWVVSFNSIVLIGRLFFKRTKDCESSLIRLIYGLGGGAIGVGYGLLFVFCVLIGLKVIGRIAENQVEIQHAKNESSGALILNLAKLKNSVELGYGRRVLESVDPFPSRFYRELDQYSRLIADPEAIQKLLEYPGFRRIWESPQVLEIERDPEIVADVQRGNILGVFTNRKVVALLNDPQIRSIFNQGDLDAALNYALTSPAGGTQRR